MAKPRGLYKRPGSDFWYLDYVNGNGERVRESTKTADREQAQRMLDDKRGRVARGEVVFRRSDEVTFDEGREDLLAHYRAGQTRDMQEVEYRLKHVTAYFTGRKLSTIKTDVITKYVLHRQEGGAANGTIRNELDLLGKLLALAVEHGKLMAAPKIKRPKLPVAREGFVDDETFERVREHLPEELRAAMTLAFVHGWRKREVLDLERHQFDAANWTLRLMLGTTKNRDARTIALRSDVQAMLVEQVERVRALEVKLGRVIPYLFPHLEGRHAGKRITDFRHSWQTACSAAGVPGLLVHDLRRSAVRNMESDNVPRSVAMAMTGHKTESIYKRYAIVSTEDMKTSGVARMEAGAARRRAAAAQSKVRAIR